MKIAQGGRMKAVYSDDGMDDNAVLKGEDSMNSRRILAVMAALCFILSTMDIRDPVKAQTSTITLTAKLTIKADKEKEFETLMKAIVPKVREEKGNLAYIMCRSKDHPRLFLFFEEYADQAAIQAHGQHLKALGLDFSSFLDGPPVAEYYEKIAD
jgi:quinol monooxygenase YgiN